MQKLKRFGVSMDSQLLENFDKYLKRHGYANRSEAVRDMVRDQLVREEWNQKTEGKNIETVGTITIIYDHKKHQLSNHLTENQHHHHNEVISMMHIHLDETNCLEVLAVRGNPEKIKEIANHLISTKGVKHGKLVMTSTGKNLT
ncbi:nickel-responsive transcriptional regulator NikR [candidate division KSB1 bacterium]|nr:MAG: nickel-responsive transcriptional regulator NikR [candidate division KSB1 bacterium]